jgi:DNA mismatch repair protein MutL
MQRPADCASLLKELYREPAEQTESPIGRQTVTVDTATGEVLSNSVPEEASTNSPEDGVRLLGRFQNLYIFAQIGDHIYVIDQHTAHERILYEQTIDALDKKKGDGQNLLFPVQVELTPEQFQTFLDTQEILARSGFGVIPFGGRSVNIEAVPLVLSSKPPAKSFMAIIEDLQSLRQAGYDLIKAVAQSIACRSAVMAGDRLTDEEALHLIKRLQHCREKFSCPHGRPTFVRISKSDLDRQFGRA